MTNYYLSLVSRTKSFVELKISPVYVRINILRNDKVLDLETNCFILNEINDYI